MEQFAHLAVTENEVQEHRGGTYIAQEKKGHL